MAEITETGIQEKLDKGEALTKEESAFVMSTPPEGAAQPTSNDPGKEEDAFDGAEEVNEKKSEKAASGTKDDKAEEPGEEKGEEADEAEKKSDNEGKAKTSEPPAPEKKQADEGTLHGKIETELEKPDGQEDLADFSEREKGLFYEMKKSRKRAQKAEEDRDALMFEKVRDAKMAKERKPDTPPQEEEEELFGKEADPEDFPTIGKLREVTKEMSKREAAAHRARARATTIRVSEMGARDIIETRKEMGKDAPDYDEVLELAPIIIEGNDVYKQKIADAYNKGRNAALVAYDLIRNDPKFASLFKPSAEAPKKDVKADTTAADGKKTLEKINANASKPKTSGNGGGGGGGGSEEYTVDQLLRMTPAQFRKVPREVRQKFLYNG